MYPNKNDDRSFFKELKPSSEVINNQPKTIIFGYGWVGQHLKKCFTQADIFSLVKGTRNGLMLKSIF